MLIVSLQQLVHAVQRFGTTNWMKVSEYMPGRSSGQCRERSVTSQFYISCFSHDTLQHRLQTPVMLKKVKGKVKECIAIYGNSITQLRSVTCRMGSHSVTCHPTQANTARLYPSQTGWYSIYRPFKDGGLSKPRPRVQRATGPRLLLGSEMAGNRTRALSNASPTP